MPLNPLKGTLAPCWQIEAENKSPLRGFRGKEFEAEIQVPFRGFRGKEYF
jgi:hypothetical protein